jgi:hypothetical protein
MRNNQNLHSKNNFHQSLVIKNLDTNEKQMMDVGQNEIDFVSAMTKNHVVWKRDRLQLVSDSHQESFSLENQITAEAQVYRFVTSFCP